MKKIRVVVAEDDQILSKVILAELKESGFDVWQARTGEEAVKLAKSKTPDLILMDVLMPKMDGFAALEAIKGSPETERIPVIMLTMLGSDDDIKRGLKLGAEDYIVKSQHAVAEICDKVEEYFSVESHPDGRTASEASRTDVKPKARKKAAPAKKKTTKTKSKATAKKVAKKKISKTKAKKK